MAKQGTDRPRNLEIRDLFDNQNGTGIEIEKIIESLLLETCPSSSSKGVVAYKKITQAKEI